MNARLARLAGTLILALASPALASAPLPAAAQMVPRLVAYPRAGTTETACAGRPSTSLAQRRSFAYARGSWSERITVYAEPTCAPSSALFTLASGGRYEDGVYATAYRTITPTQRGLEVLQQQCGAYAWSAGVVQDVAAGDCRSLALGL